MTNSVSFQEETMLNLSHPRQNAYPLAPGVAPDQLDTSALKIGPCTGL
jgi:hypothetical protein